MKSYPGISIWVNMYNEKMHSSTNKCYQYLTNVTDSKDLKKFFDNILNNFKKLTGFTFSEISSITITTHDPEFNDVYYASFKEKHPDCNNLFIVLLDEGN